MNLPAQGDFPNRIGFAQAEAIIRTEGAARATAVERLVLARAHGRVLAQEVVASIPLPPFDNSAMDGYALRHAGLDAADTRLRLVGEQFAGVSRELRIGAGQCARVTTGAPLPAGADAVVMKENTRLDGDDVVVLVPPVPGQHLRRAGEDVAVGEAVLGTGQVLTPARIALVASLGQPDLAVHARPTVAVFATGDELVEPGVPLAPGQVYNSNRELLMGLLRAEGLEPVAWPTLPDDPARIASLLGDAASSFDLVLTCGGVSAGEKDHLPELLQRQGRIAFWKVRMRPGMPLLFGALGQGLLLGLPGNPVSVLATWLALGRPLLDALQQRGEPRPRLRARLAQGWTKRHERLELLRGRLHADENGVLQVHPNPADGSHRLRGAADSDALIVLPEGAGTIEAGEIVEVLLY